MIRRIERADGTRFQVYGRADGKQVYVTTCDSLREAKAAEEDHRVTRRKIDAGELPPAIDTKRTLDIAATAWLKALDETCSRSHEEYANRVENYLRTTLGARPLVEIRKSEVIQWRDQLVERVSPATVNTVMGTLSALFTWCIGRDWIEHNPCHGVKRLKPDARVFPWLDSTEAITRLLSECPEHIRTIVAVLVGTGMRLDEALHLRWDDVDLEHRLLTVHRGRRGRTSTGTTKSGKARRVPIFDSVLSVLKTMKLARGGNVLLWPGGYRRLRGSEPERALSQAAVRDPFTRVCPQHREGLRDGLVLLLATRVGLQPPELRLRRRRYLKLPHTRELSRCRFSLLVVKFVWIESAHTTGTNIVDTGLQHPQRLCGQLTLVLLNRNPHDRQVRRAKVVLEIDDASEYHRAGFQGRGWRVEPSCVEGSRSARAREKR